MPLELCPSRHFFKAWVSEGPTGKELQAKENKICLFYLSKNHVHVRHRKYMKYKPGYEQEVANKGAIKKTTKPKNNQNPVSKLKTGNEIQLCHEAEQQLEVTYCRAGTTCL